MPQRACLRCGRRSPEKVCPRCQPSERPKNASWSPGRNRAAQQRFRDAVLKAFGYQCGVVIDGARCDVTGAGNLEAHHLEPGNDDPSTGMAACKSQPPGRGHHKLLDVHAR